jgi:hypothetical protein
MAAQYEWILQQHNLAVSVVGILRRPFVDFDPAIFRHPHAPDRTTRSVNSPETNRGTLSMHKRASHAQLVGGCLAQSVPHCRVWT